MNFESTHSLGKVAYFQPVINKINWIHGDAKYEIGESAIPVLIVAVHFTANKVLYDIALPDGGGGFYLARPLCNVDSYFIHSADSVKEEE